MHSQLLSMTPPIPLFHVLVPTRKILSPTKLFSFFFVLIVNSPKSDVVSRFAVRSAHREQGCVCFSSCSRCFISRHRW
jgi:hypothetical protein